MMNKSIITRAFIAALVFVVDMSSLIQDTGRQVDWALVTNAFRRGNFKVKLSEAVDIGETAITVDALLYPLAVGDKIKFNEYEPVVVTVGAAGALAAATSVPVDALSGPIPAGQVVHLGTNKFVVLNADAAEGATSLTTLAIPTALVDNDTGTWQGGVRELTIAAAALAGATAIVVEAPTFRFANDEEGDAVADLYEGQDLDAKFIPAGTIMVEVDPSTNRKIIPLACHVDGTSATGQPMIALTDMKNDSKTDSLTGYGVTFGGIFYENLLPDVINNAGVFPTGWKTLLGSRYVWKKHQDSRGA